MSIVFWIIEGIGVDTSRIYPYLNNRKVVNLISEKFPNNKEILKWRNRIDINSFDVEDFLGDNLFRNLADLLTFCDDTDTLIHGEDGDGGSFFYYPPSMPWDRTKNEPVTIEEVHKRIVDAIQKVADMSREEIEAVIDDDLYVTGCG